MAAAEFNWEDPLDLESQLTDEEKMIRDSARAFAQDILARVRPGSIILIHPMYRHNQVARDALPLILDGLQAQGYEVVTITELLRRTGRR